MAITVLGRAVTSDIHCLIDSDAFVGWMLENDANHQKARRGFEYLCAQRARIATSTMVVTETATVLSHRKGQELARLFLDRVIAEGDMPVVFVTEALHNEALEIFKSQTKKGTSVTDCANVAIVRKLCIPKIFSFDKAYSRRFDLAVLEV